jgi:formylglycine-generating enzyme required for sulfatase activity
VIRGGGWSVGADFARCAFRGDGFPGLANFNIGFRVVLAPGQP